MKNYNKILEAVNRGIQLALEDFADEEPVVQHVKSKQIIHRDYTKEYLDLMEEAVDLGLPSRTFWCKYNLDVNPNQLSKAKDWYGGYYAWGEIEPNKTDKDGTICFDWSHYKYGNQSNKLTKYKLTKYCNKPKYGLNGFTDNLSELLPEDDAAYQNKKLYNFKFHIPTKEQFEELINYTKNYWVNNYDPNKLKHNSEDDGGVQGLNGMIFEGKNGNQMFIPASGYHYNFNIYNVGSICYSWSLSLSLGDPGFAYCLYFSESTSIDEASRENGFAIRPVINL